MKYITIFIILLVSISVSALENDSVIIPYGAPPLLNGIDGKGEWIDAHTINWEGGSSSILLKQDSLYVYLCFVDRDTIHSGIDLYVDNLAGDILLLHVSSARGQSRLTENNWSEMDFGSQELWTSNILDNIFIDGKMKFLSPDVFEFQIARELLSSGTFKFMVHLKRPDIWIPANMDTMSSLKWIEVGLDQ
jgi:hypothetical protein